MSTFDTDEYLIPMGKYTSMREVVDDATNVGTQILTFKSTRAVPIYSGMEPFHNHKDCGSASDPGCLKDCGSASDPGCLHVKDGSLFVEAYNCDFDKPPKPQWAERAKKQLYRPDYVYAHYVHYATVTAGLLQTKDEANQLNQNWYRHFLEQHADRITDETHQAVMLHSKTVVPEYTTKYKERCKVGVKPAHGENCRVGFPWPRNDETSPEIATTDGYGYNCFTNEKLIDFWLPRLRQAMQERNSRVNSNHQHIVLSN